MGQYVKRRSDGLVINTGGDYDAYQQEKKSIKTLKAAKNELSSVKSEMNEIKQMLKILLDGKVND